VDVDRRAAKCEEAVHKKLVRRVQGYASSAMRDALREAIRTATRRRLNESEAEMFQYMLNELEVRGKDGHRG
jgi:hypothetical protein